MKRELILKGIEYLIWLQLAIIIVSFFLTGPSDVFAGFLFPKNRVARIILRASIDTVSEFLVTAFIFYHVKYNDRNSTLKEFFKPFSFVFSVHFLISTFNGFYSYTTGSFVSEFGYLWGCGIIGELVLYKSDAPQWPYFVLFPLHLLMLVGAIYIGYKLAHKKQTKEREELLKNAPSQSAD